MTIKLLYRKVHRITYSTYDVLCLVDQRHKMKMQGGRGGQD